MDSNPKALLPIFIVKKDLSFGLSIYVTGNLEVLGNWDIEKAKKLKYLEKEIWYTTIQINPPIINLEYKFFINGFSLQNLDKFEWMPKASKTEITILHNTIFQMELYIMSFNIRFANPKDGINIWNNRKNNVSDLIIKYKPDILGIQEGLIEQLDDLKKSGLGEIYDYFAVTRGSGEGSDETCAIFYRRTRFFVLDKGNFWLSNTPDIAKSKLLDLKLPRICTWLRLFDFYTEKVFYIFNTHLDYRDEKIRMRMTEILMENIEKIVMRLKGNIILLGDFNAKNDESCIKFCKKMLKDSCDDNSLFTFHGWTGENVIGKIDYIFYQEEHMEGKTFKVIKDTYIYKDSLLYPSDHFPIESCLKIKK